MTQRLLPVTTLLPVVLFITGCGVSPQSNFHNPDNTSGNSALPASTFAVTLLPASPSVTAGQSLTFTSPFIGNVIWKVNGVVGGDGVHGTIDNIGNYSAPIIVVSDPVKVTGQLGTFANAPSASATVSLINPTPIASEVSPANVLAGSSATITISGPGFSPVSQALLGTQPLATTYKNSSTLEIEIPAALVFFPAPAGGGTVRVLVAGMKAFSDYHLRGVIHLPDGTIVYDQDRLFTTSGFPSDVIPKVSVTHFKKGAEANGVQILDCVNFTKLSATSFDRDGNLIWAYSNPADSGTYYFPIKPLPNGDFLLLVYGTSIREINLAEETIREITQGQIQAAVNLVAPQLGQIALHHDLVQMPNAHYVLIGQAWKNVILQGDTSTTSILGDFLIDLDPDLNVTWIWNSFDHLDVNRHPFSTTDWTHSNAVLLTLTAIYYCRCVIRVGF